MRVPSSTEISYVRGAQIVCVPIEKLIVQLRNQPVVVRRRDIQEINLANVAFSYGWLHQPCPGKK